MKNILICYILPVIAFAFVFIVATSLDPANSSSQNLKLCKDKYALCTSARCIPQPGDSTKAICTCDVEDGEYMTTETSCDSVKSKIDGNGILTIYSGFSLKQFREGKKGMKCPGGTPWTWCLNKVCTADPKDPKKAICVCDVVRTGDEWLTLGGDCDISTCATGYWSGALLKDFKEGSLFILNVLKTLGMDQSPIKWCQIDSE